jgi:Flp pilus assembly pilin Flp
VRRLLIDRRGHTSIEYGMIAAFLAIGLITVLGSMGLTIESFFTNLTAGFAGVTP